MSAATNQTVTHRAFSFGRVGAIAQLTFTELVRLKVFSFLLVFALLLIAGSTLSQTFVFQEEFQMLKDVSLGAISIFSSLLAIAATAMLLPRDVEDRTLYTILAKPVPRFEYLLGKALGIALMLLAAVVLMSAAFALTLWAREAARIHEIQQGMTGAPAEVVRNAIEGVRAEAFTSSLWLGIGVIYIKSLIIAGFTLLVSTFATSSVFTIMVSAMIYLIGHLQATVSAYVQSTGDWSGWGSQILLHAVAIFFPDLQLFSFVDEIVAGDSIAVGLVARVAGLGVVYCVIYFLLSYAIFSRKEL